jgi:signal recognition particle receptor subunit beta
MATFDVAQKMINLKVVYYGCAMGGKTTNLITLHRLTDPESAQGLVSIATKDDRTLFFDLLPLDLGTVGGMRVRVKVFTVPGQVHYETTRRQVLMGADGVVLVFDSAPEMHKANAWAAENLRHNLKQNRLDGTPTVLQWNKRDLPNAEPLPALEAAFNPDGLVSHASVATTGVGVVETFESVVKQAIQAASAKAGRKPLSEEELDQTVGEALVEARSRAGSAPAEQAATTFEHRFDNDAYREDWAEKGRDRQIVDEETLLSEAVQTGIELSERLDGYRDVHSQNELLGGMIRELDRLCAGQAAPQSQALPAGLMSRLLAASGRSRGALLVFRSGQDVMDEREVVPAGEDPLNALVSPSIGSAAHRLCQGTEPRHVEDLASEVFFDARPPGTDGLVSCLAVPLVCDDLSFGALLVYATLDEPAFEETEQAYWGAAARMVGLSLHWRGLRLKLTRDPAASSSASARPIDGGGGPA